MITARHDERQLRRMLDCIKAARSNRMSLQSATDSLLFLRDALERVDAEWARDFTSHLATIESAGLASPEQMKLMGEEYPRLIARTLGALETLVCVKDHNCRENLVRHQQTCTETHGFLCGPYEQWTDEWWECKICGKQTENEPDPDE